MAGIQYTIGNNHLKKAKLFDMSVNSGGEICTEDTSENHVILFPVLDCGIEDCAWGRLHMEQELSEDAASYVYLLASNDRGWEKQLAAAGTPEGLCRLFESAGAVRAINQKDVLLYELGGRYLWILMKVIGTGARFWNLKVEAPGDNFLATFPEVYREKNSFFHRYLSVFSSIYGELQEKLDHREALLDLEEASEERLLLFAHWMGLELHPGYLDIEVLRTLVRELGALCRCKGTRACIERICQMILGETPRIVERSLLQRYVRRKEQEQVDELFGESPYDVTLMIEKPIGKKTKKQLLLLLEQFKPIRSRLHMVYLEDNGVLDTHIYLDQNALTFRQEEGVLDEGQAADGSVILQE